MYICLCNPFREKDVQKALSERTEKPKVSDIYKCCSGGEKPKCCSCIQTLKDMVSQHHNTKELVDA